MLGFRSFSLKLLTSYIIVVCLSFGLVAFFLDRKLEEISLREIKSSLVNQAFLIENQIDVKKIELGDLDYAQGLSKALAVRINSRITIVNKLGKVLADSEKSEAEVLKMENHLSRPEIISAFNGQTGSSIRYSATLKVDMLYVAIPLKDKSDIIASLRLALPLVSVQKSLMVVRRTVFLGTVFAMLLAFIFSWLVSRWMARPINQIIHVSKGFSSGDFSRRIMHHSNDEIGELASTLNSMASQIEEKIKEVTKQNQHQSTIFNSMTEGVIVLDKAGRIVSLNPTIEKIFGVDKKETENRLFLEAIRNNDLFEIIDVSLKKGRLVSRELTLVWPVQKIFEVNAAPIFEKGEVTGSLVVIHDITEIRKLETVRRDFVANVSHELKTPLTSIKGFVETLLEGAMDDKENSRQFLRIVQDHAERLNNLINDLLDLSSIESEKITLKKEDFDIGKLFEEVISGFRAQIKKKKIEIRNKLTSPLVMHADRNRIEQVMTNLLDNSIKFNKEDGFIKIYADDSEGQIKIFVEDSGIGIPAKDIPRIFERFYRVDKARSRELGGTGLGLSIVKHITELHGGSVGVESMEGSGAKFWFTIPKGA